jgi:transposase
MMLAKPPDLPLSDVDWQATPVAAQALLVMLWAEAQQLRTEVTRLRDQVVSLQDQVANLREQVQRSSRNSSRPPSSDPPTGKPRRPKARGRSPGGQPGHEGHGRGLLPIEQVDQIVPVKPSCCRQCGAWLSGDDPHPQRHQVTEVPPVRAQVTEYQLHTLRCPECQRLTEAAWPAGVPRGAFGPRVQALVSLLSGAYRLSQRQIQALLADGFGVELSLGTVSQLEQASAAGLAAPVAAAVDYVQQQAVANVDETGWREARRRAWLWTAVTEWVTVFTVSLSRGHQVVQTLLGKPFAGIVGSDRYSAYSYLSRRRRQICWAHLDREFQAFVDRGGESAQIGKVLQGMVDQLFVWWHRVRDGTLKRSSFQVYVADLRPRLRLYLRFGQQGRHPKTASTCSEILQVEPALWTFVRHEGVEPTNNAAERALRQGVLWRKSSFGTHSPAGSRFVERVLTVVATLRQQQRDVLEYLTQAAQAGLLGQDPPSLLPAVKLKPTRA